MNPAGSVSVTASGLSVPVGNVNRYQHLRRPGATDGSSKDLAGASAVRTAGQHAINRHAWNLPPTA